MNTFGYKLFTMYHRRVNSSIINITQVKQIISKVTIVTSLGLYSQSALITNSLNQKLSTLNPSDILKVNIIFVDQVHHGLLNAGFKSKNTPVKERARIVIRKSMQLADASQTPIIKLLNNKSNKVESYDRFWIINMMTISTDPLLCIF